MEDLPQDILGEIFGYLVSAADTAVCNICKVHILDIGQNNKKEIIIFDLIKKATFFNLRAFAAAFKAAKIIFDMIKISDRYSGGFNKYFHEDIRNDDYPLPVSDMKILIVNLALIFNGEYYNSLDFMMRYFMYINTYPFRYTGIVNNDPLLTLKSTIISFNNCGSSVFLSFNYDYFIVKYGNKIGGEVFKYRSDEVINGIFHLIENLNKNDGLKVGTAELTYIFDRLSKIRVLPAALTNLRLN